MKKSFKKVIDKMLVDNIENQTGLYGKFTVKRTDGSSAHGEKHEHCEYFVLDLTHDRFALKALSAYARACEDIYPQLAHDLTKKMAEISDWIVRETIAKQEKGEKNG